MSKTAVIPSDYSNIKIKIKIHVLKILEIMRNITLCPDHIVMISNSNSLCELLGVRTHYDTMIRTYTNFVEVIVDFNVILFS